MAQLSIDKLEDSINKHTFINYYIDKSWYPMFLEFCIDKQSERKDCRRAIGNGINQILEVKHYKGGSDDSFIVYLVTEDFFPHLNLVKL